MEAKEPKFISLEQYKMDGNFIESNNKTYTLFWDFDSRCVLFFKDKKIVYDLRNLFFVSVADIANDGSVIIAGVYEKTDEKNGIIICNSKGEKQIFKYIDSRIVNVAISENGETAVFQTYNSMISEEYDNKLFIIDVINKKFAHVFTVRLVGQTVTNFLIIKFVYTLEKIILIILLLANAWKRKNCQP